MSTLRHDLGDQVITLTTSQHHSLELVHEKHELRGMRARHLFYVHCDCARQLPAPLRKRVLGREWRDANSFMRDVEEILDLLHP